MFQLNNYNIDKSKRIVQSDHLRTKIIMHHCKNIEWWRRQRILYGPHHGELEIIKKTSGVRTMKQKNIESRWDHDPSRHFVSANCTSISSHRLTGSLENLVYMKEKMGAWSIVRHNESSLNNGIKCLHFNNYFKGFNPFCMKK